MKKLIALITLFLATPAFSADWTPYLKGMQDGCGYSEGIKQILLKQKPMPKELKGDVIKHTQKIMSGERWHSTIKLKNATAFGYPLVEIKDPAEHQDMSGLQLKFGRVDDKLLSKFYTTIGNKKIVAGTQSKTALLAQYQLNEKTDKLKLINVKEVSVPKIINEEVLYGYLTDEFTSLTIAEKYGWSNYMSGMDDGINYSSLKFDAKQKTLTCVSGY